MWRLITGEPEQGRLGKHVCEPPAKRNEQRLRERNEKEAFWSEMEADQPINSTPDAVN